jgi:polycomb protein EED
LKQAYVDDDADECFYTCAFAGRTKIPYSFKTVSPEYQIDRVVGHNPGTGTSSSENTDPSRDDGNRPPKLRRIDDDDTLETIRLRAHEEDTHGGPQLLCVGGHRKTIKVIDTTTQSLLMELSGHGDEVWDLQRCPADEWVLASASKDESIRLWNLKTGCCFAILAGHEGHRDSLISIAWHLSGNRIATAGIDTSIRIWDVGDGTIVRQAQVESHKSAEKHFRTINGEREIDIVAPVFLQMPIFSTNKLHLHCVDCVQFLGDLILSKSIEGKIILWHPDIPDPYPMTSLSTPKHPPPSKVKVLRTWEYEHGLIWGLPFTTDPKHKLLVVGNTNGELYIWEIGARSTQPVKKFSLNAKRFTAVRSLSFCPDGDMLVAAADDGTVWKWDFPSR